VSDALTTLYRPVGRKELELIRASGFRAFPSRLPSQPFFLTLYETKKMQYLNGTTLNHRIEGKPTSLHQFRCDI